MKQKDAPLDRLVGLSVRCVKCGAGYGKCDCWRNWRRPTTRYASKLTVIFSHSIGDKVMINDYPDIHGRVTGMSHKQIGNQYYVCWWDCGKRYDEWLNEWEIKEKQG